MIILLISACFGIVFVQFFAISYSFQGLNKAIIFAPISIMFKDVNIGIDGAKLNQDLVKEHLNSYYRNTLPTYCSNYTCEYYFYNSSDESMCISNNCDGVEVSINAIVNLGITYSRTMYYQISKGIKNG